MGTNNVSIDQGGGMYGLIFDNTFSKQLSKTATLVLLTYPSDAPPHSTYQPNTPVSLSRGRPGLAKQLSRSTSALNLSDNYLQPSAVTADDSTSNPVFAQENETQNIINHVGILSKRRRKRGQGYARRFFSLDFATCTLSYYYNRNSYALRGAIPLSFAAITTDSERKEIIIDSGAEIWHLKASNAGDFQEWKKALAQASKKTKGLNPGSVPSQRSIIGATRHLSSSFNEEEVQQWEQAEVLVSRIAGTRDAIRRLFKDTAPSELGGIKRPPETPKNGALFMEDKADYFDLTAVPEKKVFWRRKCSSPSSAQTQPTAGTLISTKASLTNFTSNSTLSPSYDKSSSANSIKSSHSQNTSMREHLSTLLSDLDTVLGDFSTLFAKSKRRRTISRPSRRSSTESASTAEFFDAEPGNLDHSQVFVITHRSEEDVNLSYAEDEIVTDSSSMCSGEGEEEEDLKLSHPNGLAAIFPSKTKNLDPLPIKLDTERRASVPQATVPPPSLINFLRKNVGKDLSTISMPVSANEPLSLLQRTAEQFEYAQLLNGAASHDLPNYRLLYVAAFAISNFSIHRCRERALRKPFNPMLGETFELLRADHEVPGGFRFIAEKVSHRPVRIACQADSAKWCMSHSPAPTNKFWGKSVEIVTEGQARLVLHLNDGSDELYSWNVASAFVRNVVMGEKYIEPVGSITVTNESTGAKATIDFKQKGIFGGRSEDVEVNTHGPNSGLSLAGTWTNSLRIVETGKSLGQEIWHVGDLVDGAAHKYGFTTFAASLNEITPIELGKLPISDCRLRPDQRAAELGNLDKAERIKASLEEKQRLRRMETELRGENWKPKWFVRVDDVDTGEEVWKFKTGKENYWEERSKGVWSGVEDIFSLPGADCHGRGSPALG